MLIRVAYCHSCSGSNSTVFAFLFKEFSVGNKPRLYTAVKQMLYAFLFAGFGMVKLELKTKSSSGVVSTGSFQHHLRCNGRTNS